jgi:tetratricopeptide (TPR) repeat protein
MYKAEASVWSTMKKASLAGIVILLFVGLAFGQFNQQRQPRIEDYSIRGRLLVTSAREVEEHIEVRLERSLGGLIGTAYTDSIGSFEFRNIQPGSYFLNVNAFGYEPVRQAVEVFSSVGGGVAAITIFLNKIGADRTPGNALDAADPDVIDVSQMKERFPKKAVQNFEKAVEEEKKGQPAKAIKLLEETIKLAPTFFQAHSSLGHLYQTMKRYPEAEKEYLRARELNSKSVQTLINLGMIYIQESEGLKGDGEDAIGKLLDQALDVLEEAVKLGPRSAMAYYFLGAANYKSSFFEEAEAALKKARELNPNLSAARLILANVYVKQNRWQDVLDNLSAYLQENPNANDRVAVEEMRGRIAKTLEAAKP